MVSLEILSSELSDLGMKLFESSFSKTRSIRPCHISAGSRKY